MYKGQEESFFSVEAGRHPKACVARELNSGVDPSQVSPTTVQKDKVTVKRGENSKDVSRLVCEPESSVSEETDTPTLKVVNERGSRLDEPAARETDGQKEVYEVWRMQSHAFLDLLERSSVGGEVDAVHHTKKALAKRLDTLYRRLSCLRKKHLRMRHLRQKELRHLNLRLMKRKRSIL